MELFLYQIINHVKEGMPGLSLVDENYGQLENIDNANTDMYPITFPAVLIDLQEATWSNLADRSQKGTIKVNVQLLIDCYDDTHYDSGTMEAIKERAAMVEELHRLLQGYRPKEDGALVSTRANVFRHCVTNLKEKKAQMNMVVVQLLMKQQTRNTKNHFAVIGLP